MQENVVRGGKSIAQKIEKKVMSKAINVLSQSLMGERNRQVTTKKGVRTMHRQLVIEEVSFEFNDDIAKIVKKFTQAFSRYVSAFDEQSSAGLIEGDAVGILNRVKRGLSVIAGGESYSGRNITIPHSTFYLNEKSRDVYEHYVIFLYNVLHQMGFSSEQVVRQSHPSQNHNKFIFIVSLLQWLAAHVLSQHEELGLTKLLDVFAGDLLLESKLLAKRGWLGPSCSAMYSVLIESQPHYIQLIKARRAEERLSKAAIKSINDGLDSLDAHEKLMKCFVLAKTNAMYRQCRLTPKDLDDKAFKASYHRLYQQFVDNTECLQGEDVNRLQCAMRSTQAYQLAQCGLDQLFSLLKDIAVLRKMLNALASLHETTGWLIIGLSSSVNMHALQSAFDCFHERFSRAAPLFQSILSEVDVDTQCVSIHTELQKIWAKRGMGKINLHFENLCSSGVLSYVRQEIEGALLAINKAQAELIARGLSDENVFLKTHPFYLSVEPPVVADLMPLGHFEVKSQPSVSFRAAFLVVSLSTATVVGLFYAAVFLQITVPPLALVAAVSLLVIAFFAFAQRRGEKTASAASLSHKSTSESQAVVKQTLVSALMPLENQLDSLKAHLESLAKSGDDVSHRAGIERITAFFSQHDILNSSCASDLELWRLIVQLRNAAMSNPSNQARYSEGLMLSTAITRHEKGDTHGAVKCFLNDTSKQADSYDFSPVIF